MKEDLKPQALAFWQFPLPENRYLPNWLSMQQ